MNKMANWKVDFVTTLGTLPPDVQGSFESILWAIEVVCTVSCFFLAFVASKKFSDDEHVSGLMSFLGSMVSGVSPILAKIFIY